METKHTSHLIHVESLPVDSVPIYEYGKHRFTNLYYSPENKKLYQQYKKRIRMIDTMDGEKQKKNVYVRTSEGKTVYMSTKKMNRNLHVYQDKQDIDGTEVHSGSTIPGEQSSPSQDIDTPTPVTTEPTPVTDPQTGAAELPV